MRTNALSVANYFIDLAKADNKPIKLLGLVKRVYIAHGFSLALTGKSLLDPRFDKVEAWKYGPVIPSVYHSFKNYRANPITEKTVVLEENNNDYAFVTPVLKDEQSKKIVQMVWKRYINFTDNQLVTITHHEGTPWKICYEADKNIEIPDSFTKLYYEKLVKSILKK